MLVFPKFLKAIKDGCFIAVAAKVEHPSGDGYFWEGVGELEYAGHIWRGAGLVGGISQTKKSTELRIDEIKFMLSGLDASEVAALDDDVRNRVATTYLFALNESRRVVAEYLIDEALLDYQRDTIADSGAASLEITGQTGFWILERSTDAAYSQEEAVLKYPNETGFSMIPALRNKDTAWTKT